MNNNDKVFRAIGDIDEVLIDRAAPEGRAPRKESASWLRWALPVAACLVLTVLIVPNLLNSPAVLPDVDPPAPEIGRGEDRAVIIPQWEEMPITQKFSTVMFNGVEYSVSTVLLDPSGSEFGTLEIDPAEIAELIGVSTSGGHDVYDDYKEYTINCEIYSMRSISSECAIGVKYEGHDGYFPFKNPHFIPETLGDLIDGLNLRENLVFNRIHYDYFEDEIYVSSVYTLSDYSVIWDLLLSDTTVRNETDVMNTVSIMGISIDVNVVGYRNISLSVNDSGYLRTNILDTGKSFYIGEDTVQAFVDYVLSNGNGTVVYQSD